MGQHEKKYLCKLTEVCLVRLGEKKKKTKEKQSTMNIQVDFQRGLIIFGE